MKLHLPTALFALAVLPAVAFAEEGATSYSYVVTQDGDTTKTVFTGNGYGELIENSSYNDSLNGASSTAPKDPIAGAIGGLKKGDKTGVNTDITVTGEGTRLNMVVGGGPAGYSVSGNKKITVTEGASVDYIYGLSYDRRKHPDTSADTSKEINICVMNGGKAGAIYGTAYNNVSNVTQSERITNEKVIITVNGGIVGTNPANIAIMGGGAFGTCVNNEVEINLENGSKIYGAVTAGGQVKDSGSTLLNSFVNSSTININGAVIDGYIAGGGSRFNGNTKSIFETKYDSTINFIDGEVTGHILGVSGGGCNTVNGNTKIVLSGGKAGGNVYGCGSLSTVKGNTEVVIKGDASTVVGEVYGADKNNAATVKGDRILSFDAASATAIGTFVSETKSKNFNAVGFQNMGTVNFDDTEYNRFDTLYVSSKDATSNTTVTTTLGRDGFKKAVVDNKGMLTLTGTDMKAGNLVVKDGGTVSFVPAQVSQQVVAADFSAAAAEGAPKVITLASKLELGSGSTLLLNGYALDLGANDLTVYAGAKIWTFDSNAPATLATTEKVLSGFIKTTGNVYFLDADGMPVVGSVEATVNGQTGTLGYTNGEVTFTAAGGGNVPEPATATLSLLALAGLCARRRRK